MPASHIGVVVAVAFAIWVFFPNAHKRRQRIRTKVGLKLSICICINLRSNSQLPSSLRAWRLPGSEEMNEQIWNNLDEVFQEAGFTLWPYGGWGFQFFPGGTHPSVTGFGYVSPFRSHFNAVGGLVNLQTFQYLVCRLDRLFSPFSRFILKCRIPSVEPPAPEMDLMSLSALLLMEKRATIISTS